MDDRLAEIVAKQRVIVDRWMDLPNMSIEDKEKKTQEFLLAIIAEVGEILNGEKGGEDTESKLKGTGAIRWKSWKKQQDEPDPDYVKTELIDIFHFVLELLIIWGADADEIYTRYLGKNKVNIERYKNGY
jgi:dimeric dUTPase (all-alpha-NTP-PPase superfamily)